jgi:flagellar basal-body rod protein FlgF
LENTLYVALSRQMILRREMDVVANNIANADTAAFKVEQLISETDTAPLPTTDPITGELQFVLDIALARDFTQGALAQTGSPFDVGIEGDAFFQVDTEAGPRYTRDGRFSADAEGRLVTKAGWPVAGDGGEIVLDPALGEPAIAPDGTISQNGQPVGKLTVYRFASLSALSKDGDGLYRNDGNQQPEAAADARLHQGMIESSNVQPIYEITRMIEVSREYERIARIIEQTSKLESDAIQKLGEVA